MTMLPGQRRSAVGYLAGPKPVTVPTVPEGLKTSRTLPPTVGPEPWIDPWTEQRADGRALPPLPDKPLARSREPLKLSATAAAVVTAVGGVLILLAELDGIGFIPSHARTAVAAVIAAVLPFVMYFIPGWKGRKP